MLVDDHPPAITSLEAVRCANEHRRAGDAALVNDAPPLNRAHDAHITVDDYFSPQDLGDERADRPELLIELLSCELNALGREGRYIEPDRLGCPLLRALRSGRRSRHLLDDGEQRLLVLFRADCLGVHGVLLQGSW